MSLMLFSWCLVGDPKKTCLLSAEFAQFPVGYLGDAPRRAGTRSVLVSCWSNIYNHVANSQCNSPEKVALGRSSRPGQDLSEQGCAKALKQQMCGETGLARRTRFRRPGILLALKASHHVHWYQDRSLQADNTIGG